MQATVVVCSLNHLEADACRSLIEAFVHSCLAREEFEGAR
jgi:hypothetical protein